MSDSMRLAQSAALIARPPNTSRRVRMKPSRLMRHSLVSPEELPHLSTKRGVGRSAEGVKAGHVGGSIALEGEAGQFVVHGLREAECRVMRFG